MDGRLADGAFGSDDVVELLFDITDGTAADEFGSQALVTLTGEFGANPLGPFNAPDPFFDEPNASIVINPVVSSVVPVPNGLALMLTSLIGLGAAGRHQAA